MGNGEFPPLASFHLSQRHRPILILIGLITILPFIIAVLKNRSFLPPFLLIAAIFLLSLGLLSRYEIFFLRKGSSENFQRFYSVHDLFQEELDWPRMAQKLCEELVGWLGCRKAYFFSANEALGTYQAIAWVDPENPHGANLPLNDPILSSLANLKTPTLIPPNPLLPLKSPWPELAFRLLVPVRAKDKLIGFIALGEKESGEPYYQIECKNLEIIASEFGLFLEKEELRKTLRRQLKELTSAQEILSRMVANPYHLDLVLDSMAEGLKLIFPQARLVEICLWDESERKMVAHKVLGVGLQEGYRYNLGEGLSGTIARDRRPVLIKDFQKLKDKLNVVGPGTFRSFIGVPLLYQDKLIGSLEMDSIHPNAFGPEDLRFLESLAPYFAAIIYNTQAHRSIVKEKEALLEAYKLIGNLLASGLKSEELMAYTARVINSFLNADACAIRIWEGKEAPSSYTAGSESVLTPPDWEIDICSQQDEVLITDLRKLGKFTDSRGMKAFAAVPIWQDEKKIGWIGVWKREPHSFSSEEVNWLKAFSAQVAAIWRESVIRKEFEIASRKLDSLHYLKVAIENASSLDELARKSFEAIVSYYGLERVPCCLLLFTPGPSGTQPIAMNRSFAPHLAELLASFSPSAPAEPEIVRNLKGYFKDLELLPVEFGGKLWGLFAFQGAKDKMPDLSLHLHHLGAEAARFALKETLEEAQSNLIKLLQSASDGLYVAGRGGEILYFDRKAFAITGFTEEEMLSTNCRTLYPEGIYPLAMKAIQAGEVALQSTYLKTRDGHLVPVKEAAIPLFSTDFSVDKAAVAFWDLSKEKDLEKVQDVVTIFLTHELGKLVTKLSTRLYLYMDGKKKDKSLEALEELVSKIAEVVNKIQEMTSLERGKIRLKSTKLDVAQLAKEVIKKFAEAGTHYFSLEEPEKPILALADDKMVEVVLSNLLDNAVKYSPPGSLVTVRVEAQGNEVKVSVQDQGKGIPIPFQRKIFEKFYRIETEETAKVSSFGLGLYICKLIVEAHGGKIWVESLPGHGSTFSFTLPKASIL
jgi:PAS domain S-box-containing protein